MNEITIGTVLSGYCLDAAIGRGGFAYVFRASRCDDRASEERSRDEFAVKIASPHIDPEGFPQPDYGPNTRCIFDAAGLFLHTGHYNYRAVGRESLPGVLRQEFSFLKALREELFPEVFEFSATEDACYYVLEYIPGWDFRAILDRERSNNRRSWIPRLREILVSLSNVRRRHPDFYHGDLKPENILVDTNGQFRLIDPALRSYDICLDRTLTVPYNPLGLVGPEADTFAIAAIVAELLVGLPVFSHVAEPLLEYCCSGLHAGMESRQKRLAVKSHLRLHELERALPRNVRQPIISWLLDPGDYDQMIDAWHLLGEED